MTGSIPKLRHDEYQMIYLDKGTEVVIWNDQTGLVKNGEVRRVLYKRITAFTFPEDFDVERTAASGKEGVAVIPWEYCPRQWSRWKRFRYETCYWIAEKEDVRIMRSQLWPGEVRVVNSHFMRIHAHRNWPLKKALRGARERRQ